MIPCPVTQAEGSIDVDGLTDQAVHDHLPIGIEQ
jgi:hypothetical protein